MYEWVAATRRWRLYAARSVFVALMLAGMAIAYRNLPRDTWDDRFSLSDLASFGQNLYKTVAWIEITLILMLAPAATAGAVCLDKVRGTLDHMLATDLSTTPRSSSGSWACG